MLLRFGTFEVDPRSGEVRKGGARIRIQEKPLQLLLVLLEHPGELVTRDQLRDRLWGADTFVDFDHSLATALAKLRAALGDSAKSPRFIETMGGRGYRFIAPVSTWEPEGFRDVGRVDGPASAVDADGVAAGGQAAVPVQETHESSPARVGSDDVARRTRWLATSVLGGLIVGAVLLLVALGLDVGGVRGRLRRQSNPPVRSLAVLPLQNLSGNAAEDYFADGMTEQLIATLAQLPTLDVISRTSAMRYKGSAKRLTEISRELSADVLVEGSVVRAGDRVRITAQLVDGRTDQHLWAQSYERDLADVLALQNDIARSIASEIRVRLSEQETSNLDRAPTLVPAAEQAFLRGRYHLNKGDEAEIRKSLADFSEAIALDPSHARGHAALAQAFIALTDFYERPTQTMPRARAAAEEALALDQRLADAHTALGAVRFLYDWDWPRAEASLKRALALNPASADAHVWYGVFLAQMGRFEPAIAELTRAGALDPLSVPVRVSAGWVFYLARQSDRAIAEWRKALDLEPNLGTIHTSIWLAYAQQGQLGALSSISDADADTSPLNLATIAGVHAVAGRRTQAEAVLARLHALADQRYVCSYEIATAHAALRQDDEAIRWLRRGVDERSSCMPDLKVDPRFDHLRNDPRFTQLLRDIGFVP